MTKLETTYAVEVMQAFVDGKTVEVSERHRYQFDKTEDPIWNWTRYDYRISPEHTMEQS